MKIFNKLIDWFYRTRLGGLYFDFLLWLDKKRGKENILPNHVVTQIVMEAQQIAYREGLTKVKKKVNSLVRSKTPEEYHRTLNQLDDLMGLATSKNPEKVKLRRLLYNQVVFKVKDIKSPTDRAKMIEQRIGDYIELREHKEKRELLRKIRKARSEGNKDLVEKLEEEWREKYAQTSKRGP